MERTRNRASNAATPLACEPDVDLALDVRPLFGRPEPVDELLEARSGGWSELEPGQKVERLAEVSGVDQTSRDRGQLAEPNGEVVGAFLEDAARFVRRRAAHVETTAAEQT